MFPKEIERDCTRPNLKLEIGIQAIIPSLIACEQSIYLEHSKRGIRETSAVELRQTREQLTKSICNSEKDSAEC